MTVSHVVEDTVDVIAPPSGELFSETNYNSVAILLSYGTARVLLASGAEAREEEYMASGPYRLADRRSIWVEAGTGLAVTHSRPAP